MPTLPFRSVLVTGGRGFVGRALVPALAGHLGPDAVLRSIGRGGDAGQSLSADLCDREAVDAAIAHARPDLVVHLAAQSSVAQGAGQAGDTWSVNLGGTLNLASACARHGFSGTFLFVSSAETYGRAFLAGPVTEATPPLPQSVYARSKAAAEVMLADVLPAEARLIVARPGNHSGAGQDTRFVLPAFAAQIAAIEAGRTEGLIRVGNLDAERDFLDMRDVIAAYIALLDIADRLPRRCVFNIASGTPQRIATLLDGLLGLANGPVAVEQDPARLRPSEIARAAIDASALRQQTGWHPRYSIDQMLGDILAYERGRVA